MDNPALTAKVENGHLIISIPLDIAPKPSMSGKTLVVASTHGNVKPAGLLVSGKQLTIGLNAYIPR